jgi:hypothetical protein
MAGKLRERYKKKKHGGFSHCTYLKLATNHSKIIKLKNK